MMTINKRLWKYSLLAIIPLCYLFVTDSVKAGCVQSDVNAQYAITSRNSPAPSQSNTVNTQWGETCLGNSSHGNNLQLYSGSGQIQQERERNVSLDSTGWNNTPLENTPHVNANVNQQFSLPVLP